VTTLGINQNTFSLTRPEPEFHFHYIDQNTLFHCFM